MSKVFAKLRSLAYVLQDRLLAVYRNLMPRLHPLHDFGREVLPLDELDDLTSALARFRHCALQNLVDVDVLTFPCIGKLVLGHVIHDAGLDLRIRQ